MVLNAKRATEEAAGTVRWLRPEFQQRGTVAQGVIEIAVSEIRAEATDDEAAAMPVRAAVPVARRPWPAGLAEQIKAVADVMAGSKRAMRLTDLKAASRPVDAGASGCR